LGQGIDPSQAASHSARTKNGKNLPPVLTTPSLKDTNHAVEGLFANVVDDQ